MVDKYMLKERTFKSISYRPTQFVFEVWVTLLPIPSNTVIVKVDL